MSALKAGIVSALLERRGFGPDDEVPEDAQQTAEADADAVIAVMPDNGDLDFIRVFESWGEREVNLTGTLLDLAIAATALVVGGETELGPEFDVTITTAKLRSVAEDWNIERVEQPSGWHLRMRRIEQEIISEGA